MFKSVERRARSVATLGVAAALVVGGVAAAQGGSSSSPRQGSGAAGAGQAGEAHHGMPPGPPPVAGPPMQDLTYGELHVRKEGQDQVIRLDQGKIAAVDESSIALDENDGSEVTIALDEETEVLAGPGRESTVDDLSVGQRVLVCGPEGEAAQSVMVQPKRGRLPKGAAPGGAETMPPPGAQMGS